MQCRSIFVLGRDPQLSIAEIGSLFQMHGISFSVQKFTQDYAVIASAPFDKQKFMQRLGGTLKIADVIEDFEGIYNGNKSKVAYSINAFTDDNDLAHDVEFQLKSMLRDQGLKVFGKKNLERRPSRSAKVDVEVVVAGDTVGKVAAVSDPKAYKERDEARPHFEAARVISLRLARILINLSQVKERQALLDPFCGLGTILQEACLMGIRSIGIDKDRMMVQHAKENLQWLGRQYASLWKVMQEDATRLKNAVSNADGAATEPYLGPYVKTVMSTADAELLKKELTVLYTRTLQQLRDVVGGKVAFIFPRFKTKENKRVSLDIDSILRNSGYKIFQPVPAVAMPIPYYHTRSAVERFIYVLE